MISYAPYPKLARVSFLDLLEKVLNNMQRNEVLGIIEFEDLV
jgi:hypothetical protein